MEERHREQQQQQKKYRTKTKNIHTQQICCSGMKQSAFSTLFRSYTQFELSRRCCFFFCYYYFVVCVFLLSMFWFLVLVATFSTFNPQHQNFFFRYIHFKISCERYDGLRHDISVVGNGDAYCFVDF